MTCKCWIYLVVFYFAELEHMPSADPREKIHPGGAH